MDGHQFESPGDITEATVLQAVIAGGGSVSVPYGDNDRYDLIVDDGEELVRVQCKTGWITTKGTLRFNTHSQTTQDGQYHETTYDGDIEAFVVRDPEDDELYWVDIEEATNQKMELRFDAEIDHPAINWAAEYRFSAADL
ncbi:MAG: group I intron-associated PD-(D/E)XK endonuclease [Halobacteriaceae archaeon]